MVFKIVFNLEAGITLVEIIVVIFLIAVFSAILISDFPEIQRKFALSRAVYSLGQDIRKAEDLGLSGVNITDQVGNQIAVKGYGIYFNLLEPTQYLIYADVAESSQDNSNQEYDGNFSTQFCNELSGPVAVDCIIEKIDISKENKSLYIKGFEQISSLTEMDINFSPPNPTVNIKNLCNSQSCGGEDVFGAGIVLGLASNNLQTRTVWVNKSGMIEVK